MTALTLPRLSVAALIASPAVVIFVSSNLVNVGNLAFNMLFSRWMGPELFGDLALLLTIKLALLGLMGAVQMASSQMVAAGACPERALGRIGRTMLAATSLAVPVIAGLLLAGSVGEVLGLSSPHALLILLIALPVSGPLAILRGLAFGRTMTGRVVASANVEMGVRLIGAVAAWQAGLGLEGVVAAIALSIVAGWAVLADLLPPAVGARPETRPVARALMLAALPLGLLQVAQVLALDGDVFLTSAYLSDTDAGLVAALSLFQRIQFFACFTLASVLLPTVVGAVREGRSSVAAALPVAALFGGVSATILVASMILPGAMVTLLVGPQFLQAASGLPLAALSAVAFTMSYLLATFLAALGDRRGLFAAAIAAVLQVALMAAILRGPGAGLLDLLNLKAALQGALAIGLLLLTLRRLRA